MDRQETYRGILRQLRSGGGDLSFGQAIAAAEGVDEDTLVSVACVLGEMEERNEPDRLPRENDLIWAVEFLDHLDTLGKEVRSKL
jgi:hypothetical protein